MNALSTIKLKKQTIADIMKRQTNQIFHEKMKAQHGILRIVTYHFMKAHIRICIVLDKEKIRNKREGPIISYTIESVYQ